jgi:hypothetical protein
LLLIAAMFHVATVRERCADFMAFRPDMAAFESDASGDAESPRNWPAPPMK